MHIPDGYLSPQTSIPFIGAMLPVWSMASYKIRKSFNLRQIPLLSLCAAFSFVIMMFNVPVGSSTVHAIGAVFTAVLLGPWPACVAITVALVIQAVAFGDGGILALGANCFNIAFVMPFAGYYAYRLLAGKAGILSKRGKIGAFIGSYIGINAAALLTAIELGIQPLLFKTAEGVPLYGPIPLSVTVPALMLSHLLAAGVLEGIVTVMAISYLLKFSPGLVCRVNAGKINVDNENTGIMNVDNMDVDNMDVDNMNTDGMNTVETPSDKSAYSFRNYKAFAIGLLVLLLAVPLGLLASGTAWGEWSSSEIKSMLGYVPYGLERLSNLWKAVLPDYTIPGLHASFFHSSLGYIITAAAGVLLVAAFMFISSRLIAGKGEDRHDKE